MSLILRYSLELGVSWLYLALVRLFSIDGGSLASIVLSDAFVESWLYMASSLAHIMLSGFKY